MNRMILYRSEIIANSLNLLKKSRAEKEFKMLTQKYKTVINKSRIIVNNLSEKDLKLHKKTVKTSTNSYNTRKVY